MAIWDSNYTGPGLYVPILKEIIETLPEGIAVLDAGCGNKQYEYLFQKKPYAYTGIDIKGNPDVVGDVEQIPLPDGKMDVVMCLEVLEHTKHPWIAAKELMRVLKPGGKLIVSAPFFFAKHDNPGDYYRFTESGLRELFDGLKFVNVIPVGTSTHGFFQMQRDWVFRKVNWPRPLRGLCYAILNSAEVIVSPFVKGDDSFIGGYILEGTK